MTGNREIFVHTALQAVLPLVALLLVLGFGFVLRKFLFKRLTRWAQNTKSHLGDIIVRATKGHLIIWFLMLGIYIALQFPKFPENAVHIAGKILLVLGLFSATLVLANISSSLISLYSGK
jgi:hypothetical protein